MTVIARPNKAVAIQISRSLRATLWSAAISLFILAGALSVFAEPRINNGGIVNGASFAVAPVSVGSIVSLFGAGLAERVAFAESVPLPTELGGTIVFVNNVPAPIFYVSPEQINFQVPWEVGSAADFRVKVSLNFVFSERFTIPSAPVAPGIFSLGQNGKGQGAVISEAHSWKIAGPPLAANAEAVNQGDVISIYATGLGAVSNAPAMGHYAGAEPLSRTLLPVSVDIGGAPAEVLFAGLAPGFVGLYQVNAIIPEGAPQGAEVPLTVIVGDSVSNEVTISVGEFPLITGIDPQTIFLTREAIVGGIIVGGSGFYSGGTLRTAPAFPDLELVSGIEENRVVLSYGLGENYWSPGWFEFSVSLPPEMGGGFSNRAKLAFLGNQNTLTLSGTEAIQLDQADHGVVRSDGQPGGAGSIHRFSLAEGEEVGSFVLWPGLGLPYGASFDNGTGQIAYTRGWNVVSVDTSGQVRSFSNNDNFFPLAVSASNGYACASSDVKNTVAAIDLSLSRPPFHELPIGDTPWSVAMANLPGDGLVCAVFNAGDSAFSVVKIPEMFLVRSTTISGFTQRSQATGIGRWGGWQMDVFHSGPSRGIAAVLAQFDKTLVFINLATGMEIGRVTLGGIPFRVAADEVSGNLVVAFADSVAGLTRFAEVSPSGAVTHLGVTTDLLAVGLKVSADGRYIYAAMRDQFQILPKR